MGRRSWCDLSRQPRKFMSEDVLPGRVWLFPESMLRDETPSRRDGMSADAETRDRARGCSLIHVVAKKLDMCVPAAAPAPMGAVGHTMPDERSQPVHARAVRQRR